MAIEYRLDLPPWTPDYLDDVCRLNSLVFGPVDPDYVTWRMDRMPDVTSLSALHDGALVGFKLGYAMTRNRYYSWLGGVHPEFRGQGIADELMQRQHDWIARHGYSVVETAADQGNIAMARVNLRHGFSVCGLRTREDRTQILYAKTLPRPGNA